MIGVGFDPKARLATCATLVAIFLPSHGRPQEILDDARRYLQRHGVPCLSVLRVDSTHDNGHVAVCQDGRDWVLHWVENEVAFVHPRTRETYKWQREVFAANPEIYAPGTHQLDKALVNDTR